MKFGQKGVLLANVPGSGVAKVDSNAKSGNPRHDSRSGKFGSGPANSATGPKAKVADTSQVPANQDPLEYHRMLDAVRQAAREYDTPQIGDIKDFLAGRAKNPAQVDVENFLNLVNQQRASDLVDLLDQQLRKSGSAKLGRRKVSVTAPRGFIRRTLQSFDGQNLALVMHRLEALGHDQQEVDEFFKGKVKDDAHETAVKTKTQLADSDWAGEFPIYEVETEESDLDAVAMAEAIAKNLPQPVINVTVPVTMPNGGKKVVKRDPDTGLLLSIEPEEDAS